MSIRPLPLSFAAALLFAAPLHAQKLEVSPAQILADEPATIRVTGLAPQARITLRASLIDGGDHHWRAEADFIADAAGTVDATKQAPVGGSYRSLSAMGLVWSMRPTDHGVPAYRPPRESDPQIVHFELSGGGKTLAAADLRQLAIAEGVQEVHLSGTLHGTLYIPPGTGPHPALLIVGGSEGGTPTRRAALLASHGYEALALAYFRAPGLPDMLENIPLEYFGHAISWMLQRPEIDTRNVGVLGGSRGGELAFQLGSLYPQLHAVVAFVPANVRVFACCGPSVRGQAAWTLNGAPLASTFPMPGKVPDPSAEIAIERIHGPILMISGGDDGVWPSRVMATAAMARLKHEHFAYAFQHLTYDHAGHHAGRAEIVPTYAEDVRHPVSGQMTHFGGTPEGNAASTTDVGPKLLDFLKQSLSAK